MFVLQQMMQQAIPGQRGCAMSFAQASLQNDAFPCCLIPNWIQMASISEPAATRADGWRLHLRGFPWLPAQPGAGQPLAAGISTTDHRVAAALTARITRSPCRSSTWEVGAAICSDRLQDGHAGTGSLFN